jgi:CubicO group peptidase (beta-lactamase class C family)
MALGALSLTGPASTFSLAVDRSGHPAALDDKSATTRVLAADQSKLAERLDALKREAQQLERLRSIVVLHQGRPVVAESFRGPAVNTPVNIKSVSKSIVASLVGCAIERGIIEDVQMTLGECIPDLIPQDADDRVSELTLENLLTMQAGLQRTSGPYYGKWINSDNWMNYVLTRPFVAEPGARMLYSTGDWHVLGIVLSRLADASLWDLANEWLGDPLGIRFAPWTRDPQGYYLGGNEMALSPMEMARFGELYRQHGQWNDVRVFKRSWVRQSFAARTLSPFSGDAYGYGWFIRRYANTAFAYARGYGGQFIHVLPAEQMVVAMTSDWTRSARGGRYTEQLHSLITNHLLG